MIKIVKLVTGEELIADTESDHNSITLNQPCAIQLIPNRGDPSQTMMGLIPYASYTEDFKVTISLDKVIWQEKPSKEIYNQYNSAFGSGIQLAGM
jgi:hypothetical protein